MYKVTITVGQNATEHIVSLFAEAINIQKGASTMMQLLGWTRHSACTDIVRHMSHIADLYNEGSVMVEKID